MDDLIKLIYGHDDRTPICAHCHRPLLIVTKNGQQMLYCKHCADLEAEERETEQH